MSLFRCRSLAVALALLPLSALAADPMTDAIQAAYAPYRVALFKTNGKSLPESRDAVLLARHQLAAMAFKTELRPVSTAVDHALHAHAMAQALLLQSSSITIQRKQAGIFGIVPTQL